LNKQTYANFSEALAQSECIDHTVVNIAHAHLLSSQEADTREVPSQVAPAPVVQEVVAVQPQVQVQEHFIPVDR
jgi:hypothetical protein